MTIPITLKFFTQQRTYGSISRTKSLKWLKYTPFRANLQAKCQILTVWGLIVKARRTDKVEIWQKKLSFHRDIDIAIVSVVCPSDTFRYSMETA